MFSVPKCILKVEINTYNTFLDVNIFANAIISLHCGKMCHFRAVKRKRTQNVYRKYLLFSINLLANMLFKGYASLSIFSLYFRVCTLSDIDFISVLSKAICTHVSPLLVIIQWSSTETFLFSVIHTVELWHN